jgi:hypothetical protein
MFWVGSVVSEAVDGHDTLDHGYRAVEVTFPL